MPIKLIPEAATRAHGLIATPGMSTALTILPYQSFYEAAQGLQGFLAAQGLHGLQGFLAAQGLHGLQGFLAAQGLHGLQGFLAAQGLHGFCAEQGFVEVACA